MYLCKLLFSSPGPHRFSEAVGKYVEVDGMDTHTYIFTQYVISGSSTTIHRSSIRETPCPPYIHFFLQTSIPTPAPIPHNGSMSQPLNHEPAHLPRGLPSSRRSPHEPASRTVLPARDGNHNGRVVDHRRAGYRYSTVHERVYIAVVPGGRL